MTNVQDSYERYLQTWSGKRLLEQYSLDQEGLWQIRGEDPNCDLGGNHYQPDLGIVEGKLRDVIEYGVGLSSFWQWGSGGDFKLIDTPKKIDPAENRRRVDLQARLLGLQFEVDAIKRELGIK